MRWHVLLLAVMVSWLTVACAAEIGNGQAGAQAAEPTVEEENGEAKLEAESSVSPSRQVLGQAAKEQPVLPAHCPVTLGQATPFVPPEAYPAEAPWGEGWYGSNALWTSLPPDGVWRDLPWNGDGYTQKVLWWRDGYRWNEEPEPALTVTGRRLDGPAPPLESLPATNAFAQDIRSAMLVGVSVPTTGCWEITGRYGEAELSFVVWVTP